MKIAVAGGTGVVGSQIVKAVRDAGSEPVVLARGQGVDAYSGDGLAPALVGVDAVIDALNVATLSYRKASDFFTHTATTLAHAAEDAGVRHLVGLSIVGVDQTPTGYYRAKLDQERAWKVGGVPATVVRASQFHEFPSQVLKQSPGPVAVVPAMPTAPVSSAELAQRLVAVALGSPHDRARDVAGPRTENLADLARQWLRHQGLRRKVVELRLPLPGFKQMAQGGALPDASAWRGRETFAEWLERQP